MVDLPPDEEILWRAAVAALRANGATHSEAVEGANMVLAAYQRQRAALRSMGGGGGSTSGDADAG